jgi:hypothetical protein
MWLCTYELLIGVKVLADAGGAIGFVRGAPIAPVEISLQQIESPKFGPDH